MAHFGKPRKAFKELTIEDISEGKKELARQNRRSLNDSQKTQCLGLKKMKGAHSSKDNRFYVTCKSKNFKDNKTSKNIDQTPSVADEKAKTQGEMTCLSNSRWSQNKDSGLWLSCLLTYV